MVEKSVQGIAGFKIVNERMGWNTRAAKDGRTAENFWIGMYNVYQIHSFHHFNPN